MGESPGIQGFNAQVSRAMADPTLFVTSVVRGRNLWKFLTQPPLVPSYQHNCTCVTQG